MSFRCNKSRCCHSPHECSGVDRWWVNGWCHLWINSTRATSCGKALNVYDGLLSKQIRHSQVADIHGRGQTGY